MTTRHRINTTPTPHQPPRSDVSTPTPPPHMTPTKQCALNMRPSRTAPLSPSEPSTSITIPHRRQMPDRHTNTTNNANHCHTITTTHITNTCNKRHQGRSHVQSAAPTHLVSYKTRMQTKKVKHPHSLLGQARPRRADTLNREGNGLTQA